jgi:hypothetical protein
MVVVMATIRSNNDVGRSFCVSVELGSDKMLPSQQQHRSRHVITMVIDQSIR